MNELYTSYHLYLVKQWFAVHITYNHAWWWCTQVQWILIYYAILLWSNNIIVYYKNTFLMNWDDIITFKIYLTLLNCHIKLL